MLQSIIPELKFTATRSRGPGGQNVNKVSSSAILTWDFEKTQYLNEEEKARVRSALSSRLNKSGELSLRSDVYRDLQRNKEECLAKLDVLLRKALFVPKRRKKTKATKASREKRLLTKSRRGSVKGLRRKVSED